ncbi:hypothetical protein NYO67_1111 [Aspergillus flavus]|nr:hypothetical protein NYO67_1111 [Aspergillus flavus]
MRQISILIALFLAGSAASQGAAGSAQAGMPGSYPESPPQSRPQSPPQSPPSSPKPGPKADTDKPQPALSLKAELEKRCREISIHEAPRDDYRGSMYAFVDTICDDDPKNYPKHYQNADHRDPHKPKELKSTVNLDRCLGWDKKNGGFIKEIEGHATYYGLCWGCSYKRGTKDGENNLSCWCQYGKGERVQDPIRKKMAIKMEFDLGPLLKVFPSGSVGCSHWDYE